MTINPLPTLTLGIASALLPLTTHANFKEASKHLDLDGSLVGYMDFEGDGTEIGTALNSIYEEVTANTPEMPPIPVDFNQLFTNLGFGSLRSVGFSSTEVEPGLHRNRSVALLNGEPTGLFAMYGNDAHTFDIAEKAPADATGAITVTMDLTVLRDTTITVLQQIMGPMGEGIAQQQLAQPIPGTDITINEAIETLSGKWDGFWLQSYTAGFEQEFKFWVSIEGAGSIFTRLQPLASELPVVFSEDEHALKADLSALLGEDALFGLLIEAPKESDALILYSHADWTAASKGQRLSENPEFAALAKRLPKEGLSFQYSKGADLTPMFAALEALPDAAKYQGALQSAIDLLVGDYLKPNIAVCTLEDGAFLSEQYAGYSTKQVVMVIPAAIGAGVGAAMAVPAFQKVRTNSQEKAVTNNLRQIYYGGQQYMLEEGVNEVRYEQLIGPNGYIKELQPIAGESYGGLTVKAEGGEISVTLANGTEVSYRDEL
jgi:type IV pilus assembly protein PilA